MTIEIRYVGPGDEDLFDRIAPEVFDHPVERRHLGHYLATPGHHLVVAIADGEIVGHVAAIVHRHPDGRATELYIDEVAVTPARQRQGIARRMLDVVLALGKEMGCEESWVGAEPDNEPAKGLYLRRSAPAQTFLMYVSKL